MTHITHEHLRAEVASVRAELADFKEDTRAHRQETRERLAKIEGTLLQLKGGWKVLALLGAILAGTLATAASFIAILKGLK